jgi:aminoglycoside phosphotransferase (APT) family kinase protein
MHAGELEVDERLVRRLLAAQFPQWADLALERVASFGTDFAIFRLGDELAVRLPRIEWAADQPELEQAWLPRLAPHLPLAVPAPLATGEPEEGFPWRWTVAPWLPGRNLVEEPAVDAGPELARFVLALRAFDTAGAPESSRGRPLATRDRATRRAIAELDGKIDTQAVTAAWERALALPPWQGPPLWSHGDLLPGNLLAVDGRLSGVIDWGGLGVGDPAAELIAAWATLDAPGRDLFRKEVEVDEATWERGRGLALSVALLQIPYYEVTNPILAGIGRRTVDEALSR